MSCILPSKHNAADDGSEALYCWAPPAAQAHRFPNGTVAADTAARSASPSQMGACLQQTLQETLAKLPKLQRLMATNNQLRTLPLAFGHMRHVKELNLGCACPSQASQSDEHRRTAGERVPKLHMLHVSYRCWMKLPVKHAQPSGTFYWRCCPPPRRSLT